ncbi:MAG: cyclic nucleotide-binding domain-containing protein [Candidatus Wallbacteria bacterium]|nr:cyclic nucleotide-binding domain-containing protein [Candidatus Wallbacteria bacterium]
MEDEAEQLAAEPAEAAVRRPHTVGSQPLLERRPRRRDDVEELAAPGDGRAVLLHPDEGRYLELSASEAAIWGLLDGTRTVEDLIGEMLRASPPLGPDRVGQALLRFAREGLLTGAAWGPGIPGRRGLVCGRIDAHERLDKAFRVFVGFFLIFLPFCGLVFLRGLMAEPGLHLIPKGGSVWGLLLAAWFAVCWRQVVVGCAILVSGRDIPCWGLGFSSGVPSLFVDRSGMLLAGRAAQAGALLAGLWAPLSMAGIAALALQLHPPPLPEPFLAQLVTVGLLMLFLDVSPIYDTDGCRLYQMLLGREGLRDKAFALFSRKWTGKLRGEKLSEEERALFLYAAAGMVWALLALKLGVHLYGDLSSGPARQLFTEGPALSRVALAGVLAGILGASFYALALVVWIPISCFVRPLGRRVLATLVTPLAAMLSLGLVMFCDAAMARMVCGIAGFITMFPLMRARKTFQGSPVGAAVFALGLFAGVRSLTWAAGAAAHAGLLAAWMPSSSAIGVATRLSSVLLLLAAWHLRREASLVPAARFESALLTGIVPVLLAVAGFGLWRNPSVFGLLDALDLVAGVGVALAAVGPICIHAASPACHFWRPLGLSLLALAAAGAFGFTIEPGTWPETGSIRWEVAAWPLAIAAAVATRLWVDHQWRRPVGFPRVANAGSGQRQMLLLAAQVLVNNIVALFAMGLGERKAEAMVRAFNRLAERELKGEALLVNRELDVAGWEERDAAWLIGVLKRTLDLLEESIVKRAGRRFASWARTTAMGDLYWFEQELLRHYMPESFPAGASEVAAADRLDEISRVPFFSRLAESEFSALMRVVRLERYHAGDRVVRQGDPADRFYVVARGELTVLREDPSGHAEPLGHLVIGDCFGESAFVSSGRRAASVVACEDVELYTLGRGDLERLMGGGESIAGLLEMLVRYGGFLRTIPALSVLPAAEIGKLAARLEAEQHPANKVLLKSDDPIDRLYLVQDGRVAVLDAPDKGARKRLDTLTTGQCFGERALLEEMKSGPSLVAEARSRVLTLAREEFRRVMREYLASYETLEDLATPRAELR